MADSATSRMKLRKQSLGSNTNTWGDTKLNDALDTVDRATKGYESTTLTGSLTLTWSNYTTTNSGQVAVYRLAGSLSSAPTLTVPATEWVWDSIINETGQTLTVKTSGGTGITIPTGYRAAAYCDGTDVYYGSPTRFGGNIYAGGQVKNVTNGSDAQDAVTKTQMDAAIAAATTSTTPGTARTTSLDTTSKFIASLMVEGTGIDLTVLNPGANETLQVAVDVDEIPASETSRGTVELATTAEVQTGTDTVRATTPAGVKAVANAGRNILFVTALS